MGGGEFSLSLSDLITTVGEYVNIEVTKDALSRYLGAVDISELERIEKLREFVLECQMVHTVLYNLQHREIDLFIIDSGELI